MSYINNFLFSETYLNNIISSVSKDEENKYFELFESICEWFKEYKNDWKLFENTALDLLGFEKEIDDNKCILYSDTGDPTVAAYLLNLGADLNSSLKGRYYAVEAVKYARDKNLNWVILTNGYQWRLYSTNGVSPFEFYFEVDLKDALEDRSQKDKETIVAFGKMFLASSFRHDEDQICLMNKFKEQSDSAEEIVEDTLRSKAENILTGLCYGLKEDMHISVFDETTREQIYEDAIILLYRLLFLGYAEARNLLPVIPDDPDYQDSFSALCETARDYCVQGRLTVIGNEYDLWTRLDSQLRYYVDKNYNGGLFSNDDKLILREHRISNVHLAKSLMELAYTAGKKKDYSQKIEYKDLSVRNLGAIYEGLLEYQLFVADETMVQRKSKDKVTYHKVSEVTLTNSDKNNLVKPGEIYLSQDALERKETGAYYTPEDVVDYIVKSTVGKKLDGLKKELLEDLSELKNALSYEPNIENRKMLEHEIDEKTMSFIENKVLKISIVDSAMGSGHFLVNSSYYIANYIVELLEENEWENEEIIVDLSYWKRKVVENCIYGIDINPLSVLLARLSLWLISASNEKALSFVDHHLKCGNSIIGTTFHEVQYYDETHPILTLTEENYMKPILNKYALIKQIGSDTKEDVARQQEIYNEINDDIKLVKRKMDFYLASEYAGGISNPDELYNVLAAESIEEFDHKNYDLLFQFADQNQFFHWEIEFPEVYIEGGFDIAIGNPPYVECKPDLYSPLKLATLETRNLYPYMLETTINKLKFNGSYGFIVPLASMYSTRMKKFQFYLKGKGSVWVSNYSIRPSKIFKNAEQRVSIIIGNTNNKNKEIFSTDYQRWYEEERPLLFKKIQYLNVTDIHNMEFIPKISSPLEKSILDKLSCVNGNIGNYLDTNNDNEIVYHSAARYWLKAFDFWPIFKDERTGKTRSSTYMNFFLDPKVDRNVVLALINSSLFYWYWIVTSDARHFLKKDIIAFPFDINLYSEQDSFILQGLVENLMDSYKMHSVIEETNSVSGKKQLQVFYPSYNKTIIDKIEPILGRMYGFTDDEIEFIKNYDLRFRMGDEEDK